MAISDAWKDIVAGWFSGAIGVLAAQPVDTALTRWQAARPNTTIPVISAAGALNNHNHVWKWSIQDTKSLIATNSWRSLWRGSSAMIGVVPIQNALLMGGYGIGQQYIASSSASENDSNSNGTTKSNSINSMHYYWPIFFGGCSGGILQSFLMSPVELIKVTQQVQLSTTLQSASTIVVGHLHNRDYASFWRGLSATLLRDGIPHGIWFVAYDWCKETLISFEKKKMTDNKLLSESVVVDVTSINSERSTETIEMPYYVPLVSGAFAATVAWGVGYPADLIKTRIQANGSGTILGVAQEIISEDPQRRIIASLYRGFGMKLARSIPANMIGFFTYEFVKQQI